MLRIHALGAQGWSLWADAVRRAGLGSGELGELVSAGLRGARVCPTALRRVIAESPDYDEEILRLAAGGLTPVEIGARLLLADLAGAADLLRPVYDASGGTDGYACLELSLEPDTDAQRMAAEGRRLFSSAARPNAMITVPATPIGCGALREFVACGVNVQVAPVVTPEAARDVADACLEGLTAWAARGTARGAAPAGDAAAPPFAGQALRGPDAGRPASRGGAVFIAFPMREVDLAIAAALDPACDAAAHEELTAAAAQQLAADLHAILRSPEWETLARRAVPRPRLVWTAAAFRDPTDAERSYLDMLPRADGIAALPAELLMISPGDAGVVPASPGAAGAATLPARLAAGGIDLPGILAGFIAAYPARASRARGMLAAAIAQKHARLTAGEVLYNEALGAPSSAARESRELLRGSRMLPRLRRHDHTIWKSVPDEIANRLGWLHSPALMREHAVNLRRGAEACIPGSARALLLGMGGSSLAPEVLSDTFGSRPGHLELEVLDSTDPGAVLECARRHAPEDTLFIVATKSGGTVETLSLAKYFYQRARDHLGAHAAGARFVAITDPGSGLEALAQRLRFRAVFLNDPRIGGRYSALSAFGLVPAALMGIDLEELLERALSRAAECATDLSPCGAGSSGAALGSAIGALARLGRDKLTLRIEPLFARLGAWIEQLVAESTGKEGRGVLPVIAEDPLAPEDYAPDRCFVALTGATASRATAGLPQLVQAGHPVLELALRDPYDLGGEFYRWEIATAVAAAVLEVNPFDQPNVEAAKQRTRAMLAAYRETGRLPQPSPGVRAEGIDIYAPHPTADLRGALRHLLARARLHAGAQGPRGYVAIHAFLPPRPEIDALLRRLRGRLLAATRLATTLEYGPRFLHSTGQLHKGDAGRGLFIQLTCDPQADVPIPDEPEAPNSSVSFGVLELAQALGDRQALGDADRTVVGFHLGSDPAAALARILAAMAS